MITGGAKTILFELFVVWTNQDFWIQIWLNVLKACFTTSKLQWSNPKYAFCLWKLGEDIHQSIIFFLVFLVKDFDSQSLTISARSLLGALALPLPWPPQLTPVPVKLAPGPARHELTHLRILILGVVGLATMQDHGTALLLLNGCGYCADMIVSIFLIDITSSFCSFKACWFPLIFSTTWWSEVTQ